MTTVIDRTTFRAVRHPEKQGRDDTPILRKPQWLRVRAPGSAGYNATRQIVKDNGLVTVCEEAACPNIGECWTKSHATMMIMGQTCTRACAFCNVATGLPDPLDAGEPDRVARAVAAMGLKHVVITSVDRDDLPDGGAAHFAATVAAIRLAAPGASVEILTPDFLRKPVAAAERVIDARPDVFNHNLETVPRLYLSIRPGARYYHSLRLLERVKERAPELFTKSGLMVGLGETKQEVMQVMDDMRSAGVDFVTIGQYLQPTRKHAAIERFVPPEEFHALETVARAKGFLMVSASPLTRSSHHAGEDFARLQAARRALEKGTGGRLRHSLTRILPYTPAQLFTLVGDVERYPEFIRWVSALRAWNRRPDGEGVTTMDAEAQVKFSIVRERFATRVRLDDPSKAIHVQLLSGPFRKLESRWRFQPHAMGCELTFEIDFEFGSRFLGGLLAANFDRAVARIIDAFDRRAKILYG